MKKIVCILFVVFLFPLNIFAYSLNVIPGGESVGIKINTDGLVVVGFYKVNGEYIAKNTIKIGDVIKEINGKSVYSIRDINSVVNNTSDVFNAKIIRNGKMVDTVINIEEERGAYKTGLYIKDSVVGIGTLTYIDPISKIYGALGHEIVISENNNVEIRDGDLLLSNVNKINMSRNGRVGAKDASIYFKSVIGNIKKNTNKGLFGIYSGVLPDKKTISVAKFDEIKKGEAKILTVTESDIVREYKIEIIEKYNRLSDTQKAFSFRVVDDELIDKTGGIVQGMSGSPIVQDGKLIGAVTNVMVDNVEVGYGISIITMLEEGEK